MGEIREELEERAYQAQQDFVADFL